MSNLTNSLHKINKIVWLIGGGILVLMALLVREVVPHPVTVLHQYGALPLLPPLWLLQLLWVLAYFIMGGAWLCVLWIKEGGAQHEIWRYRGSMCLVVSVLFTYVWYLLLFGTANLFLSWLCLCIALVMLLMTLLCYFRVLPLSGWALVLTVIFWGYVCLIHLVVMLHI